MSLTSKILIGMGLGLVLGVICNIALEAGIAVNFINNYLVGGILLVVGKVFIASLKLLVVPLVFVSLVTGAAQLGGNSRMGAVATRTLGLYLFTTAAAITLALLAANIVNPGEGFNLTTESTFVAKEAPPLTQVLIDIFPSNPVAAMADGNMLQIIVFAILFGIALSKVGEQASMVRSFFDQLNDVIMKLVMILMQFAPYGVFALIAKLFTELGFEKFQGLLTYFFTVAFVLILHAVVTYGSILTIIGINVKKFLAKMTTALSFAFSTSSSGATLPITLRTTEKRLGVSNSVASFSVPLGATINMDGTAIMQGVATVFIAQAFAVDITMQQYLMVIVTATLASIGTAGVPGVGLIMLAMVLQQVGLPVEGIALIIGVDRLLDMMRTCVNITGDATVSATVAKSLGEMDMDTFNDPDAGKTHVEEHAKSHS